MSSFLSSKDAIREDRVFDSSDLPSIVMIVFDELPQTSLLDENREIDSGRYPNFAELAGTSTWYRNTTALHFSTWVAIPSILTGSDFFPYTRRLELGALSGKLDRRRLPSNLFSLFEDTHRIIAMESQIGTTACVLERRRSRGGQADPWRLPSPGASSLRVGQRSRSNPQERTH